MDQKEVKRFEGNLQALLHLLEVTEAIDAGMTFAPDYLEF